jgi:TetR/AcrR family transcriptional regulator, cholesterol catabolism regulator
VSVTSRNMLRPAPAVRAGAAGRAPAVEAPARRRRRHLERTREDILEATADVVEKFGYQGSRVEEICTRARVSRGAFYHHFPSKEAAVVALIETNLDRLLRESRRIARRAGSDPVRMIALEFAAIMRWVASDTPISRAYFVEMLGVPEADELRERVERQFADQVWVHLEPLFASGELTSKDTGVAFRAFAGMMKETAVAWTLGRVEDLDRAIAEIVRLALLGLGVATERAEALASEASRFRPSWPTQRRAAESRRRRPERRAAVR